MTPLDSLFSIIGVMFQFILDLVWFLLLCGVVLLLCCILVYLFGDDLLDLDSTDANALFSDADALFSVAKRLEKLNRGSKVYIGLRIPDPDSVSRRNIDLVLVNNQEAVVISVKNVSGSVSIDKDGNWLCRDGEHSKIELLPDPVAETKQLTNILEEYLEQRGVSLPEGHLSFKVICPNPNFRSSHSASFQPEVITLDRWTQLKSEDRNLLTGWINSPLLGLKKIQESSHEKLNSVLSTAPVWDRLEIRGNRQILGDFIELKGNINDILASREIDRSRVSTLTVQKKSLFSFDYSTVQILYAPRDYRVEEASYRASQSGKVSVTSNAEIIFQPQNSISACKVKVSSVESLSLSA